MEGKFYKTDLHIHTPASKCYKGKKHEEEFIKIIKKAKINDIKVISITDHNSIDGYKYLLEIKTNYEKERDTLLKIKDSKQTKKEIKIIEKKLNIFRDILILPGLEYEVSNGIHFLVIFDNEISIKLIDNLLRDSGYDEEQIGLESPTKVSNWDVLHFLDVLKKFNCITICSHFDSDKGVYNPFFQRQ